MNEFCECSEDGHCFRYNRHMGGRLRELCAGINVDLGTAAAFREQWRREAAGQATTYEASVDPQSKPTYLRLKTDQAPGDAVAMTAAIYSLHTSHPRKYVTLVESRWPEVFEYNPNVAPYVVSWSGRADVHDLHMHYPAIHECNARGIHFMQGWCEFLSEALRVPVPLLTNRPHLYFPDAQPRVGDYWVICSGGKTDFTNKLWGHERYQEVVRILNPTNQPRPVHFVQVGNGEDEHPLLHLWGRSRNMVGLTTLRMLFDLVRRARGVVCGVSLLMHVAAALEKPAIVIAGGREPVQWNAYPKQHYLHTVGALPCSTPAGDIGGACWRSRVVPLGSHPVLDKDTCERPVGTVPQCMTMIRPSEVADLILRYNAQYEHATDR